MAELHGVEDFGQVDEHEADAFAQRRGITAGIDKYRRNNHKARQEGDDGVKDLDLGDGGFQAFFLRQV